MPDFTPSRSNLKGMAFYHQINRCHYLLVHLGKLRDSRQTSFWTRCHLLNVICFLEFVLIVQHEERLLYQVHLVTSRFFDCSTRKKTTLPCTYGNFSFFFVCSTRRKTTLPCTYGNLTFLIAQHEERPFYHVHVVTSRWNARELL